jgi:hypothetical protein
MLGGSALKCESAAIERYVAIGGDAAEMSLPAAIEEGPTVDGQGRETTPSGCYVIARAPSPINMCLCNGHN